MERGSGGEGAEGGQVEEERGASDSERQHFDVPLDVPQDYASAAHPSIGSQVLTNLATNTITISEPELTRTGRRWKRKDMSGLSLCLCGERAPPGDAGSIQCQRAGCETVWVSNPVLLPLGSSMLNLLSTISNALGTRMHDLEAGLVRFAR
jgi:hypothetical protein